ncbi:MAG: hypothetical protein QM668_20525 [Agriterribacter sp.]
MPAILTAATTNSYYQTKQSKLNFKDTNKTEFIIIVLLSSFISSCCGFIKADDLGQNFVLSEYDNVDRRILYSEDKCSGSGIEVVPMTVLEYAYNSKWIIAKSAKSKLTTDYEYWIIDKDFKVPQVKDSLMDIIKSHVYGPFDSTTFISRLNNQRINLTLKKI